jgi:ribonuclease T1
MRKRNPIGLAVVAFGIVLAVLLVIASARRAKTDPSATATTSPVAVSSLSPTGTGVASSTATVAPTAARSSTTSRTTVPRTTTVSVTAPTGMRSVRISALPPEAQHTLQLIDAGGPFPYDQDGVVFQNREKLLPAKASGYYHEYTVVTPGSSDRGTRRVITGANGERYYTDDHYASFRWVVP